MRSMSPAAMTRPIAFGSDTATSNGSTTRPSRCSHQGSARVRRPPTAKQAGVGRVSSNRPLPPLLRWSRVNMAEIDLLTVEDRVRLFANALADERDHFPVVQLFTPDG